MSVNPRVVAQIANNLKERGMQDLADIFTKLSGGDGPSEQFVIPSEPCRLSLSPTEPVTSADVSSSNIYVHPIMSDGVFLWDGTQWIAYPFEDVITVPTDGVSTTGFDLFLQWDGQAVAGVILNWASTTARAVELELIDGVYVSSADNTMRYFGSGKILTGACYDTTQRRWLWNYYNRRDRPAKVVVDATWVGSGTLKPFQNSSSNSVSIFRGIVDSAETIDCRVIGTVDLAPSGALGAPLPLDLVCGIGVNSTTTDSSDVQLNAFYDIQVPVEIVIKLGASAMLQYAASGETVYYPLSSTDDTPHSGEEFSEGPGGMIVRAFQ